MKKLKFGSKAYRLKYLGQGKKKKRTIKTRGYKMAKKKKHYSKGGLKGGFMNKAIQVLAGATVAVLYEVFVSPYIPLTGMIKNLVEMVIGIFLASSKKMPMIVRAGGTALAIINAYELIAPYISGMNKRR